MSLIFAHRGSAGTHPENTMAAYIEAEKVGAEGFRNRCSSHKRRSISSYP